MMQLIRNGRDLRVDFFRGIALFCIFLDHIPHDTLARFTVRNLALNDATEIFILLAGFAAALVYGRKLDRAGPLSASADMLKRAWTLYIAHIFLFVLFAAQVAFAATWLGRPQYLSGVGIDHLATRPLAAIVEAVPLLYQPAYLNVLPLYVAIMGGLAPLLFMLRFPRTLLALSVALYVGARIYGWNLPTHGGHGWFFNPFTWQLLFVLGMLFSRHGRPALPGVPTDIAAVLLLLLGFGILLTTWLEPSLARHIPAALRPLVRNIDKTGLHPYRLISILSLAWLAARHLRADARLLDARLSRVFILIGQYGLPTYCASILLSYAGRIVMDTDHGWAMQIIVNLAGLAALFGVAALSAWYRVKDAKPSVA
ncbi:MULTISPECIES: OpgC domain-containing protein [unclassified Acidiphilium]|jgi:hypothetical protein|uniref:OpgC domain-containing protein n=2 Tax=Acidiphilium TaxID=522 RepID=UPI000BD20A87|nr:MULTISPECIES: OpgC domain-containing protein [unclassified Acidiphilium]OYV55380.1 MAG: hypothetical protein B7Z76_10580 [Acidiphilium sp. 20-67-58]OYV86242.1 MAG: hypothetical protein B7Z64_03925 [Acidiphilium sp. 21-68-69]HQT61884.1 OpgC domain-containing protein [Acidiphilium sp.]